ncbi:MAG: KEOPS complex subunit Cgi121, partial [Candidatus Bathyarchaeia archaeon]
MIKINLKDYGKSLIIINLVDVSLLDFDYAIKKLKTDLIGIEIQFFDSKKIAGWEHVYFAALNALKAFQNKNNISKSLSMELLIYASAERQIKDAIQKIGIKPNEKEVTVAIIVDEK